MKEHVFLIRIWHEYREIEGEAPGLRGMIQHAVSGEKQYFNDISSIAEFLVTHLHLTEEVDHHHQTKLWEERMRQSPTPPTNEPGAQDGSV